MQLTNFDVLCAARRVFHSVLGVDVRCVDDVVDVRELRLLTATVLTGPGDVALTMTLTSSAAAWLGSHHSATNQADPRGAPWRRTLERGSVADDPGWTLVAELAHLLAAHLCALIESCGEPFRPTLTEGGRYRISFPGLEISNLLTLEVADEVIITVRLHARSRHTQTIDLRGVSSRRPPSRPI